MPRKNKNGGHRREFGSGAGAVAPPAFFPPPLGKPKYSRRGDR